MCGKRLDRGDYYYCHEHEGILYRFCSAACWSQFRREPEAYLKRNKRHRDHTVMPPTR
ncbi:MAG: YHS domain-containing protein [Thermodesulfobacteriota bacterium]